jgi:hypothetical protein
MFFLHGQPDGHLKWPTLVNRHVADMKQSVDQMLISIHVFGGMR